MAGLGLDWGGRGCPFTLLPPFQPPAQSLSLCSPGKAHQGDGGVGGPGEHKEKDDQQLNLGHLPLILQPLPLPGTLTAALAGPESLESSRKRAESGSDPAQLAVSARATATMREPSWTWPSFPCRRPRHLGGPRDIQAKLPPCASTCGVFSFPKTPWPSLKPSLQKTLSPETF